MAMSRENNFIYLFIGMLTILLAAPLINVFGRDIGVAVMHSSLLFALILGVWSLINTRIWFRAGIALVLLAVILTLLGLTMNNELLLLLTLLIGLAFLLISTGIAIRSVFLSRVVDTNKIIGAVCIYLMIGIIWAMLYYFLYVFYPDAFQGLALSEYHEGGLSQLIYYSFVTLTTLGIGDITPLIPMARTLSYLEAVTGQIYLTVLVAALVGMHISHHTLQLHHK